MDQVTVASQWALMTDLAQSFVFSTARGCPGSAAGMMTAEGQKFLGQRAPAKADELPGCLTQHMAVTAKISAIAHAYAMARMHPNVAEEIYAETKKFCDHDLPCTTEGLAELQKQVQAVTTAILRICREDTSGQIQQRPRRY
jgi:hypothetical protein